MVVEQRLLVETALKQEIIQWMMIDMPVKLRRSLSARNRLKGTVTSVKRGGVVAGVEIKLDGSNNSVYAVITNEAVDELKIKKGDKVAAIIKSTSVMVSKDSEVA